MTACDGHVRPRAASVLRASPRGNRHDGWGTAANHSFLFIFTMSSSEQEHVSILLCLGLPGFSSGEVASPLRVSERHGFAVRWAGKAGAREACRERRQGELHINIRRNGFLGRPLCLLSLNEVLVEETAVCLHVQFVGGSQGLAWAMLPFPGINTPNNLR